MGGMRGGDGFNPRRYALGEITLAQFQEMKLVLGLASDAPGLASTPEHEHH